MNRRRFLSGAAMLPLAAHTAVAGSTASVSGAMTQAYSSGYLEDAPIAARYQLCLDRVLHGSGPTYTPDFLLEDIQATPGRRFTEFSGDLSGRWIGALATASSVYGQRFPSLDEVVRRTIALQKPDGYFGSTFHFEKPTDVDMALLWGNGRLLVGLMEYYRLTHDPMVLESANRLGEFLLRIAPQYNSKQMSDDFGASHFASSYICWTQQTEGVAALYDVTKKRRYRDLCAAISERIERRPTDHVHGYLCSLRGTLDLYQATGEAAHLKLVETAWQDVYLSGDLLVTGGIPEAWSPKKLRTEGCGEADWLRLNLALWRATGKPMYLDAAEKNLFNEFAMNQSNSGDFGNALLNESGIPRRVYVRAWWCCTLHGLRAFPDAHRAAFRTAGKEVFYDLPIDGHMDTPEFSAHATSTLAKDGTVSIRIGRVSPQHTLTPRRPSWAEEVTITRNGRSARELRMSQLTPGETIRMKFSMSLKKHPAGDSPALQKRSAFFFGPWLLGAASHINPDYFNELQSDNILRLEGAKGSEVLTQSPFSVPIAATSLAYIPAEFPEQPCRVELRAIAEQPTVRDTEWEIAFLSKG